MLNRQRPNKAIAKFLFVVSACLIFSGCYKQYFFPVEISELTISPIYRLEIQNDTSHTLVFLPRAGANEMVEEKPIPVGKSFSTLLQIKKMAVGNTAVKGVVTGSYIDSGRPGTDTAYINYMDSGRLRQFVIDIGSDSWFEPYEANPMDSKPFPKTLKVRLTDQNLPKPEWFREGPGYP
jgi:hypothetical protein